MQGRLRELLMKDETLDVLSRVIVADALINGNDAALARVNRVVENFDKIEETIDKIDEALSSFRGLLDIVRGD